MSIATHVNAYSPAWKFWLQVSLVRACLEGIAIILVTLPILHLSSDLTISNEFLSDDIVIALFCSLWIAVRLRIPEGPAPQQIGAEAGTALAVTIVLPGAFGLTALALIANQISIRDLFRDSSLIQIALFAFIAVAIQGSTYVAARACVRAWIFWGKLRRASYMWSLTHAILLTVALIASPLVLLVANNIITRLQADNSSLFSTLRQVLPVVLVTGVFALIGLGFVLIVAAGFSFIVARQLTDRLKALAIAAGRLRSGDYEARVTVQGEDEVAQLQRDFNDMAAGLNGAIEEVKAERDTVATVLESRRQLVASISHELRTPVATLRGYLESAEAHWSDSTPESMKHDLDIMQREAVRLQTLIDDLFTLARAEVSQLEMRPEPVELNALVGHSVETVAPLAWQSGRVEVTADLSPQIAQVYADPARIEQIVYNLLHNAIRHTPPGGIIAVSVSVEPSIVSIEVRDTGEGISPADLPHIWERFYRAGNTLSGDTHGAGLGLALVKELAESMSGMVAVQSVVGQGSCFSVRLPRIDAA